METFEGSVREVILLLGCMVTSLREFWRVLCVEFVQLNVVGGGRGPAALWIRVGLLKCEVCDLQESENF